MTGIPDANTITAFGELPLTLAIIAVAILSILSIASIALAAFFAIQRASKATDKMSEAITALKDNTASWRIEAAKESERARTDRERFANSTAQALAVLTSAQDTLMTQQRTWTQAFDARDRQRTERLQHLIGGIGDAQQAVKLALDNLRASTIESHASLIDMQQRQHDETMSALRELTTVLSDQIQKMSPEQAVTLARDVLVEFREGQKAILAAIQEVNKLNDVRTHPPTLAGAAAAASGYASGSPKRDTDRLAGGHP